MQSIRIKAFIYLKDSDGNIIFKSFREKNKANIKQDDFFYAVDNSFENSGIGNGHQIIR